MQEPSGVLPEPANGPVGAIVFAGRQVWGVLDQALFSASSFLCSVAVGRNSTAREFGVFAVAYVGYVLALGAVEAFTAEVVVLRMADRSLTERRQLMRGAAGCALLAGAPLSAIGSFLLIWAHGPAHAVAAPVLLFAPLLFVQDVWRYCLFALDRPRSACSSDLVWFGIQGGLFVILDRSGASGAAFVWAWCASGAIAMLLATMKVSMLPSPRTGPAWAREHGRLGRRFALEYIALFGSAQSAIAVVGASTGLVATAGYRASQLAYGPLQVALNAARLSVTPLIARSKLAGWAAVRHAAVLLGIGLVAVSAAATLVITHLPNSVGEALFGVSWLAARSALLPMGITCIATGVSLAALSVLRVAEAVERTSPVRVGVAALTLALGSVGAIIAASGGAATGVATAQVVGAALLCWHARKELQSRGA